MCTLIVYWQCHPVAPLVVAQCRDELLDRVARWTTTQGFDVVSGRDVLAGGTWFGVGPRVVCGLTNRHDGRGPRRGSLSRGDVVVSALEADSVDDVARDLAGKNGADYGPFSLLAVDDERMLYADNGAAGDAIELSPVAPGVHVLGNRGLDNPADPVVRTCGEAARALLGVVDEGALVRELQAILARHGEGWPCVHRPDIGPAGYGTRSAGVLVGSRALFTTEQAPDSSPWRDSSALLRD